MAMLQVECRDCGATFSLRGWIEPEDLIGTQWEGYTNQDIVNAEKENPRIFESNEICPFCGSSNVISI